MQEGREVKDIAKPVLKQFFVDKILVTNDYTRTHIEKTFQTNFINISNLSKIYKIS